MTEDRLREDLHARFEVDREKAIYTIEDDERIVDVEPIDLVKTIQYSIETLVSIGRAGHVDTRDTLVGLDFELFLLNNLGRAGYASAYEVAAPIEITIHRIVGKDDASVHLFLSDSSRHYIAADVLDAPPQRPSDPHYILNVMIGDQEWDVHERYTYYGKLTTR